MSGNLDENWKVWIQKFEIFSIASELNKKPQNVQFAQLLYLLGKESIINFKENEKDNIDTLKEKFKEHFVLKKMCHMNNINF